MRTHRARKLDQWECSNENVPELIDTSHVAVVNFIDKRQTFFELLADTHCWCCKLVFENWRIKNENDRKRINQLIGHWSNGNFRNPSTTIFFVFCIIFPKVQSGYTVTNSARHWTSVTVRGNRITGIPILCWCPCQALLFAFYFLKILSKWC